ncbi:MAG: FIG01179905: hypothetical protein, partial [uncultured Thermomicrobiales bacterium]
APRHQPGPPGHALRRRAGQPAAVRQPLPLPDLPRRPPPGAAGHRRRHLQRPRRRPGPRPGRRPRRAGRLAQEPRRDGQRRAQRPRLRRQPGDRRLRRGPRRRGRRHRQARRRRARDGRLPARDARPDVAGRPGAGPGLRHRRGDRRLPTDPLHQPRPGPARPLADGGARRAAGGAGREDGPRPGDGLRAGARPRLPRRLRHHPLRSCHGRGVRPRRPAPGRLRGDPRRRRDLWPPLPGRRGLGWRGRPRRLDHRRARPGRDRPPRLPRGRDPARPRPRCQPGRPARAAL